VRITIVQGAFLPVPARMGGAIEKVWFALGCEFARRGHSVTHLSRAFPGLPPEETIAGVRHVRVGGFNATRSGMLLKLLDLCFSLRILRHLPPADIIVTNTFWLPILLRTERTGRIYVHVGRYPKGQMRLYRNASRFQTCSVAIGEAIAAEAPALASMVSIIPYALPPGLAAEAKDAPPRKQKWVLYAGRIHPEKGIGLLIHAFFLLPREVRADWKLVIVGPSEARFGGGGDKYLSELKELTRESVDAVEWVGAVFDDARLAAYYRDAAVFCYPSLAERGETFGVAVLEAMANGAVPVVSALACFRGFVEDGITGFVFDHRAEDPAQNLSDKLGQLLPDPARLRDTGGRARKKSGAFSVENVATLFLEDFESLIKGGG
jgi:glycosyltransferase involved in cell wall biosynthesis